MATVPAGNMPGPMCIGEKKMLRDSILLLKVINDKWHGIYTHDKHFLSSSLIGSLVNSYLISYILLEQKIIVYLSNFLNNYFRFLFKVFTAKLITGLKTFPRSVK